MHFADSIFIFLLALVLFGPKRLPEIGRQIGKLLAEFRRASNEFKMQIDEELRNLDRQEEQKKLEAEAARNQAALGESTSSSEETAASATPTILPPSTGEHVSASAPWTSEPAGEPDPKIDPPSPSDPPQTVTAEAPIAEPEPPAPAAASLNGAAHSSEHEHEDTSLHHG